MALRVVHVLEVIEIDIKHGDAGAAATRVRHRARQRVDENTAIEETGENVELRHSGQLLFGFLAARDVAKCRQQKFPLAEGDRLASDLGPKHLAILPLEAPFHGLRRSSKRLFDEA